MTGTRLVHRAEQAVLGAMIIQPERISRLSSPVTPDHFADRRHQAIFAALAGTSGKPQGILDRLRGLFTRFSRDARETARYMETLPQMCPDAGHVTSYVRMLGEARAEREAAAREAGRQAAQATAVLTDALRQLARAGGVQPEVPADVARLARAVSGKARQLTQAQPHSQGHGQEQRAEPRAATQGVRGPAGNPANAPAADRAGVTNTASASRTAGNASPAREAAPAREPVPFDPARIGSVEDLQDHVLAALLRDQAEAGKVTEWLPAEAFARGGRRELFTLIAEFARNRDSIDPLTLAWAAGRRREQGAQNAPDPDFAFRIGALSTTTTSSAQTLARMLLADHVCTASLGPDWFNPPQLSRLTAPASNNETVREAEPSRESTGPAQETAAASQPGPAAPARPAPVRLASGAPPRQNRPSPARPPGTVGGRQGSPAPPDSTARPAAPVEPPPAPAPDRNVPRRQW